MLPYVVWTAIITLAVFLILERVGKNEMAAKQKFGIGQKVMLCLEDDGEFLVTVARTLDPTSDALYVVTRELVVDGNSLRPLTKQEIGGA